MAGRRSSASRAARTTTTSTAIADALEPGDAAALLVWEDLWAARFAQAVRNADGELILYERIPYDLVVAAIEEAD